MICSYRYVATSVICECLSQKNRCQNNAAQCCHFWAVHLKPSPLQVTNQNTVFFVLYESIPHTTLTVIAVITVIKHMLNKIFERNVIF